MPLLTSPTVMTFYNYGNIIRPSLVLRHRETVLTRRMNIVYREPQGCLQDRLMLRVLTGKFVFSLRGFPCLMRGG